MAVTDCMGMVCPGRYRSGSRGTQRCVTVCYVRDGQYGIVGSCIVNERLGIAAKDGTGR